MKRKEFEEIFYKEDYSYDYHGCPALKGLKIIEEYLPGRGIEGAEHDVICSVSVDELLETNIKKEDIEELRRLGWFVEEESLACFV